MSRQWTRESMQEMARSFQPACVLLAGAELGVFDILGKAPASATGLARQLGADARGVQVLLDALTALELLDKSDQSYSCRPDVAEMLTERVEEGVLAVLRHQANCLRNWAQLAQVVKAGRPPARQPSILGGPQDHVSFIEAMHQLSRQSAPGLVRALDLPPFAHLLDVGGGPGTWTIEFLGIHPSARATLFDLPEVLPLARRHLDAAGLTDRVQLVGGDLSSDAPLPPGADLAWVSAIIHMFDRQQTRRLLAKVRDALAPGGRIAIRDVLMDPSRTAPVSGALFAVNMLVNTATGRTYALDEIAEDLATCGFGDVSVLHRSASMDSVVSAERRN